MRDDQLITKLEVRNLSAFRDLEIDFSPKINIIIGENSTGKTHVLKSIYAATNINSAIQSIKNNEGSPGFSERSMILNELKETFDPKIARPDIFHNSSIPELELAIGFKNNDRFSVKLCEGFDNVKDIVYCDTRYPSPTFIPSKEMMFFLPDLLDIVSRFEVRVDQTHSRIISAMTRPKLKQEYLGPAMQLVIDKIEELIGGKFIVDENLSLQFLENGHKRPANMMAEGFRKFGVLSRLIQSGKIEPNKTGPLLWDEPEINLNPKLIKSLVEILIELSRAGQQIILVTHNFMLLRWFDLLTNLGNEGIVTYHNLYREMDSKEITVSTSNVYSEIVSNSMENAFDSLVDHQLKSTMEMIDAEKN